MLKALWALVRAAVLDAAKEKAEQMTKEEAKELLEKLGVKVAEISDDVLEKVEAYKSELDTETRRKVRSVWMVITGVGIVVGIGIGLLL